MATAAATRRQSTTPARRALVETVTAAAAPLKVDRDRGIIRGVKVLGRFSRNTHKHPQAEGTEYSEACMDDAVRRRLYEGVTVRANHPPKINGRRDPAAERDVHDSLGKITNVRKERDAEGNPGLYGDLHYLKTHPLAESVCEDVERGLGVYGLSHNADAGRDRFDPATRRLVIESLADDVRSVDLVDRPATNRNLWESQEPRMGTVRQVIEAACPKLTPGWVRRLFEDDYMAPAMEAPVEAGGGAEGDLKAGLMAALTPLLDEAFESGDAGKVIAAVRDFVKLHAKHAKGEDVADADLEESDDDDKDKKDKDKPGCMTESEELAALRGEKAARTLCESLGYAPTAVELEAVAALPEPKRRPLVESLKDKAAQKPAAPGARPKSGYAPKPTQQQQQPAPTIDAAGALSTLRG